ncbi:MAG: carbon-nitrogen hydrolase family protein [Alphaproteobacteria bacterium]|nr:carbon-nitrogen hydrolase family protein [Alphaproteobacteria bacterium]
MDKKINVALIQTSARPEIADNLALIDDAFMTAADGGAEFILTPENSCHMVHPSAKKLRSAPAESGHPFLEHFTKRVQERGVWLLLGSLTIKGDNNKLLNRSYLLSPKGAIVARYDKIHLFDVDTPDGVAYRESQIFDAGERAALVHSDIGRIGMSICYDVRFPHLYRDLAQRGAEILTVPAAFTVPTGQAHWETLLRARAIENGAFVLAPAQTGTHEGERETWGHSMIIDPWGKVIAAAGEDEGIVTAEIDLADVALRRSQIPSLKNGRPYKVDELRGL